MWVDLTEHCVHRGEEVISLRPKVFAVLRTLLTRPGHLFTADSLRHTIWPDTTPSRGVLKNCLFELRDALGDDVDHPRLLRTIPGQGYMLQQPIPTAPSRLPILDLSKGSPQEVTLQRSQWSQSHLVGRTAELTLLRVLFDQVQAGQRHCVIVSGESGIGKTTLIDEFLTELASTHQVWIARGRATEQHGQHDAYLPLLEACDGFHRSPEAPLIAALFQQYAPQWLALLPALREIAPKATAHKLPSPTREGLHQNVIVALEALSQQRPVVLWVDDLHWADLSTIDLLQLLARRRESAALLLIVACRPTNTLDPDHPLTVFCQELTIHKEAVPLSLSPIAENAVWLYVAHRFPTLPLLDQQALAHWLFDRTEGLPLFFVTAADAAVNQKIVIEQDGRWHCPTPIFHNHQFPLPRNLQQLTEYNFQRLSRMDQRLLEVASVIGHSFSAAALAAILEELLDAVDAQCTTLAKRQQFLYRQEASVEIERRSASRYTFRHSLYREVIYQSLSLAQRGAIHRRIAQWMEKTYGPRVPEVASELATHYERSHNLSAARHYWRLAADRALQQFAYPEAITHLRRAVELLAMEPETPDRHEQQLELLLALGPLLMAQQGWAAPAVGDLYEEIFALNEQVGMIPQRFGGLFGHWIHTYTSGRLDKARIAAKSLLSLAEESGEPLLLCDALHAMGNTAFRQGQFATARSFLARSVAQDSPTALLSPLTPLDVDSRTSSAGYMAWVLFVQGYPEQAQHQIRDMVHHARTRQHPLTLAWALNSAVWFGILSRNVAVVREYVGEQLSVCTEYTFAHLLATARIAQGWVQAVAEYDANGLAQIAQGCATIDDMGAQISQPLYRATLVEAASLLRQWTTAQEALTAAHQAHNHTWSDWYTPELQRWQGELFLQQRIMRASHARQAEACFQEAIRLAQQQEAKLWELRATMSLVRLWQQQRKLDEARKKLKGICEWFTEGFESKDLQEAKTLLEELSKRSR
jgi:DNA-binding winged helix-turn-helix (wHTH) protein/type II secretory pathway predicted ATPase ExeA/tetratricopeptide (TPR) repeat protein